MAESAPQIEVADNCGSTIIYGGDEGLVTANVTTTPSNIPAVAGDIISGASIEAFNIGSNSKRLYVSFDGGTSFKGIRKNSIFGIDIKGQIKQMVFKSNVGTISSSDFEIVINFED